MNIPRPNVLISWLMIAVSALALFSAAFFRVEAPAEGPVDDRGGLAVLTFQSKVIVAGDSLGSPMEHQLPALDQYAATPRLARALASVHAFVTDPEEEPHGAWNLLERNFPILDEDPAEMDAHLRVRRAIEDPASVDDETFAALEQDLGWFAELLRARGLDEDDPVRTQLVTSAGLVFAVMVGLLLTAGAALVVGIGLLIVAVVLGSRGEVKVRFEPDLELAPLYLRAFAIYLAAMLAVQVVLPLTGIESRVMAFGGLAAASILGVAAPVLLGRPWNLACREMGLHTGEGLLKEAGAGIVGYVTFLPLVAVGFGITVLFAVLPDLIGSPGGEEASVPLHHPVAAWMAEGSLAARLGVLFLAAVFAPVFEELTFRGQFLRGLRGRLGWLAAPLVIGVIFAMIHPQGWVAIPALSGLGLSFCLIRQWRDSIVGPMVAHGLHNGTLVALMWVALS
ncbi:hypothetical protein ABI59_07050 [Acidobacteria bacterium Mor1]|nr:hypothetical protein ABI59_07050 [Acidobacteria bacterium Mor1]